MTDASVKGRILVRKMMTRWQTDSDLACVRSGDALACLRDEERQKWEKFWDDVRTLHRRAGDPE